MDQDNASTSTDALTVAQALRLDMERLGLTSQAELAAKLDNAVTQQAISEWVKKDHIPPSRHDLLAEKLGLGSHLARIARNGQRIRYRITMNPSLKTLKPLERGTGKLKVYNLTSTQAHHASEPTDESGYAMYLVAREDAAEGRPAGPPLQAWPAVVALLPEELRKFVGVRKNAPGGMTREIDYASDTLLLECVNVHNPDSMPLKVLMSIVQLRVVLEDPAAKEPVRRVCMLMAPPQVSAAAMLSPAYAKLQDDARAMGVTLMWASSAEYAAEFIAAAEGLRQL